MENGNSTQPNTPPNNLEQTLSQEQKLNLENVKRILYSENTTLPSLRNTKLRTVKAESNKVNQVLTYISTNNMTELNELIYAGGGNLVCEKICITSKNTNEKSKPEWEFRLETQIKKSTKTGQNEKKGKALDYVGTKRKRQHKKITIQLE